MNVQYRRIGTRPVETESVAARAGRVATDLFAQAQRADACAEITPDALSALYGQGLAMAPFPSEFGGEDLTEPERVDALSSVLRVLGSGDLSVARLFEGHVNAVALLLRFGHRNQVADLARKVAKGSLSGVWGAEDAQGLHATEAEFGWLLTGRKIFASGAGLIQHPLVTATAEAGQILCLLDLEGEDRADLSKWTPLGMRSSATGTVELSGLRLAPDRIVGQPGAFMRQPHFSGGAWRFCAVHLGAMERLVDLFREHLVSRCRDGDPYQLQRLAHCVAATTTTRLWVEAAARRLASQDTPESIVALANLTRTTTERAALDVIEAVQRGVGLGAFIHPNPIERISRDLATYLRQPVPDLAMANAASAVLASGTPTGELWASDDQR